MNRLCANVKETNKKARAIYFALAPPLCRCYRSHLVPLLLQGRLCENVLSIFEIVENMKRLCVDVKEKST